jgi:hypothetical protein
LPSQFTGIEPATTPQSVGGVVRHGPLGDMFDAADQGAAIKSVHLALEPQPVGPL